MIRTIILDNGHGYNTAGKMSPKWADGSQLFEYQFNREIVKILARKLKAIGVDVRILVDEINDVSLQARSMRANKICKEMAGDCLLVSVHANAGGGTGWECYTTKGETKADAFADIFYKHAERILAGWKIRKDHADGDSDKEKDFYILKHTECPAILTENLFMDTEKDCKFLMSENGKNKIVDLHFEAIREILSK